MVTEHRLTFDEIRSCIGPIMDSESFTNQAGAILSLVDGPSLGGVVLVTSIERLVAYCKMVGWRVSVEDHFREVNICVYLDKQVDATAMTNYVNELRHKAMPPRGMAGVCRG